MKMIRSGGLSLTLAVALVSGCSSLKHKNDVSPVVDSGAITSPAPAEAHTGDVQPSAMASAAAVSGRANDIAAAGDTSAKNPRGKNGRSGKASSGATAGTEAGSAAQAARMPAGVNDALDLRSDTGMLHFGFDEYTLSADDRDALTAVAAYLKTHPDVTVELFGHTDERGTTNYNLALGEKRGQAAETFLRTQGIAARRIDVVSYGESKPVDNGHDENAWAKNRRVEIILSDGGHA